MTRFLTAIVTACTFVGLWSVVLGPASAQAQDEDQMEKARSLFMDGVAATEKGEWGVAADAFKESYELSGRVTPLLNYGISLKELGRFVESKEVCERLLRDHDADLDDVKREQVRGLRDVVTESVALIKLRGMGRDETYEIIVNDLAVEDEGKRPVRVELDPGPVKLTVKRIGDENAFQWNGELAAGERQSVLVELQEADSGESILGEWWFWAAVGGAAAVGLGLGLFFVLDANADLEPTGIPMEIR